MKSYVTIDLKSFYASAECIERGLDPLKTNLVVADSNRTEKTICLAVTPSLKAAGIPGRPRLFEVIQKVEEINNIRKSYVPQNNLSGSSYNSDELSANKSLAFDYIVAPPRMALYMKLSTQIYKIYLKYVSPEDIHVYSVDEVFIDVTSYLKTYNMSARELTVKIILDIFKATGITAVAGIGTNLYLSKIALDIMAKHVPADENGVHIAELDEMLYRKHLWEHRPITDFWRIGKGYAKKLASQGLYTMGDIARCSIGKYGSYYSENLLYKLFGINAELLIDHAWGWEPCTIADIKSYKPTANSISSGQVLKEPYTFEKARLVLREMADLLILDLVEKELVTDGIMLTICYDTDNPQEISENPFVTDHYGRKMPKPASSSTRLEFYTSSTNLILKAVDKLFCNIVDKRLLIRKLNITFVRTIKECDKPANFIGEQLDIFSDISSLENQNISDKYFAREKNIQLAMLEIRRKFGKNAILKGMDLEDGATTIERNQQVGGHLA